MSRNPFRVPRPTADIAEHPQVVEQSPRVDEVPPTAVPVPDEEAEDPPPAYSPVDPNRLQPPPAPNSLSLSSSSSTQGSSRIVWEAHASRSTSNLRPEANITGAYWSPRVPSPHLPSDRQRSRSPTAFRANWDRLEPGPPGERPRLPSESQGAVQRESHQNDWDRLLQKLPASARRKVNAQLDAFSTRTQSYGGLLNPLAGPGPLTTIGQSVRSSKADVVRMLADTWNESLLGQRGLRIEPPRDSRRHDAGHQQNQEGLRTGPSSLGPAGQGSGRAGYGRDGVESSRAERNTLRKGRRHDRYRNLPA